MKLAEVLPSAALLLLTFTMNVANNSKGFNPQALHSRIRQYDHVAVATCNRFWNYSESRWMQRFPRPVSHWTLPRKEFHEMTERNLHDNMKTVVILPAHEGSVLTCLETTFRNETSFYLVDWIVATFGALGTGSMEHLTTSIYGRSFACSDLEDQPPTTADQHKGCDVFTSLSSFKIYSMNCGNIHKLKHAKMDVATPLRNSRLRVACYKRSLYKISHPCSHSGSRAIKEALRFYNTTISISLYKTLSDIFADIARGIIDVHLDVSAVAEYTLRRCSISPLVTCTYETFYAQRNKPRPVSLFSIVLVSKRAFYMILVALASALLALGFADFIEFRYEFISATLDSVMFLVASFYATSSPIAYRRRCSLSRKLVYGVWLVAVLPLSNYIRSELTSRLTFMSPAESLDTPEELMKALDTKRVSLCVVAGYSIAYDLEHNYAGSALHSKLHSLYTKETKRTELVKKTQEDCLKCAARESHICLSFPSPSLLGGKRGQSVVESKQTLRPIFATTPMSKNLPFARAYHKMVRRLFESPIVDSSPYQYQSSPSNKTHSTPQSGQIEEFAVFFSYFLGILGTAAAVLLIEILIGHCRIEKLSSNVYRARLQDQCLEAIFGHRHKRVCKRTHPQSTPPSSLCEKSPTPDEKSPSEDSSSRVISIGVGLREH